MQLAMEEKGYDEYQHMATPKEDDDVQWRRKHNY
jgi:hypothetical protein